MLLRSLAIAVVLCASAGFAAGQNANLAMNANVSAPPPPPAQSTLRGRVYYADTGRPVRRAAVMLINENGIGGPVDNASALTDSEGNFQIRNLRAGIYYAVVNAPGIVTPIAYADFNRLGPGGSEREAFESAFGRFDKIVINGLSDADVLIPAKRGGAISGRITYEEGDPAVGIRVEIQRKNGESFLPVVPNFSAVMAMFIGGSNQTDDRGMYRFSGLPAGEYRIKVTENISHIDNRPTGGPDAFLSLIAGAESLVTVFYPSEKADAKEQTIAVEYGTEITEINLVLPSHSLHRLSGKVVAGKEKLPVNGATVTLVSKAQTEPSLLSPLFGRVLNGQTTAVDENGNWSFKELPKGDYQLLVEVQAGADINDEMFAAIEAAEEAAAAASNTKYVRKPKGPPPPKYARMVHDVAIVDKDISDVVIEMGSGATISGVMVAASGKELPASVTIGAINDHANTRTTDVLGTGELEPVMPSGMPRGGKPSNPNAFTLENVTVGKTSFMVFISDEGFYVKSVLFEGRDLLESGIDLKEGQTLTGLQIVVANDVGELSGKVVLDDGKEPAKRARFTLVPLDGTRRKHEGSYRTVTADEDGAFKLKAAPREYAVLFDHDPRQVQQLKKSGKLDKWLDERLKGAPKVTVKPKESTTVKLTLPAK